MRYKHLVEVLGLLEIPTLRSRKKVTCERLPWCNQTPSGRTRWCGANRLVRSPGGWRTAGVAHLSGYIGEAAGAGAATEPSTRAKPRESRPP